MKTQQTLIFNLDDTILVYGGVSHKAWVEACDKYGNHFGNLSKNQLLEAILTASHWFWSDEDRFHKMMHNLTEARRQVVYKAVENLTQTGVKNLPKKEIQNALADHFTKRREELMYPFPGAIETLQKLRSSGTPMIMLTNSSVESQQRKIDRFELAKYFDHIVISGAVGFDKPDKRVFQHALDICNINSDQAHTATMIGDSLRSDIFGAQQLGIHTVWNDWRKHGLPEDAPAKPDRIIHAISELI